MTHLVTNKDLDRLDSTRFPLLECLESHSCCLSLCSLVNTTRALARLLGIPQKANLQSCILEAFHTNPIQLSWVEQTLDTKMYRQHLAVVTYQQVWLKLDLVFCNQNDPFRRVQLLHTLEKNP